MKTAAVWKRRGCIAVLLLLLIGSYVFSRNLEWVNSENSRDISPEKAPFPADGGREAVTVALEEVKCFRFEDTVKVQGSLKSKNYALVSSRTDNLIEEIFVREGDHVVGDETKLFRLDSLRLEKEVQIARRDLQAARFSVQEKMANLRKTEVELYKAELDYNRYRTLYEESAVSKSAFEDEQSRYEQLLSLRQTARSVVELSREGERKAVNALAIAEKELRDAVMLAPLDGVVSQRMAEPGEMAARGKPILRIDDVHSLEATAFLPGQFYAKVIPGTTCVRIGTIDWGPEVLTVKYKSPVVDPSLRTFEIKCDIGGDRLRIVPGVLVDMQVVLDSREGLSVPQEALLDRDGTKVLFVARDGAAHMVWVKTGLEVEGRVEVTGGGLASSDMAVVKGQFLLDEGTPLRAQQEEVR